MKETHKLSLFEEFLSEKRVSKRGALALIIASIAVSMSLYHLYSAYFGQPTAFAHRSVFLTFSLVLIFLLFPLGGKSWGQRSNGFFAIDLIFAVLAVAVQIYILYDIDAIQLRWGDPSVMDTIAGTIVLFLVLEASRRTVGWAMVIITGFFVVHTVLANYFPGILNSPATPWSQFIDVQFSDNGIYSMPVMVMASFIILFLIFSQLLIRSGAGNFFLDTAYSIAGRMSGGPAKTAVLASATMGTLSGSAVANVVTTGSFTIPLMKRTGYPPVIAGAIEAVASTGGILMPPIMGAAGFIIAQFLGLPYLQVCIHALLPAIFYFTSVMIMVHFEAKKAGLKPLAKGEVPEFLKTMSRGGHLFLAVIALVIFLVMGYTAMMAAFWAILIIFVLSFLRRETRLTPVALLSAFEEGARATLTVGMACACAGIIIGSIYLSGLGMRFAQLVVVIAGGKLWLTLIYVVFVSILLGMGMPAAPVYLTLATIVIPALTMLGVTPIAAHLFCFYYGAISGITPPVALAAFAGGAISGESPTRTSYHAFKIGIAAYIIPFMFIYNNSMLLMGSVLDILWVLVTTFCGVFFLAAGVEGWMLRKACIPERIAMILVSVVVIKTGLISDLFGFGLMGILIITQLLTSYPESIDQWTVSMFEPFRNVFRRSEIS